MIKQEERVTDGIIDFVNLWQERIDDHIRRNYQYVSADILEVKYGSKFAKVVTDGSVKAFIDLESGDIYKPASTQAPAKHARGNIFSLQHGMEAVDGAGYIKYLR